MNIMNAPKMSKACPKKSCVLLSSKKKTLESGITEGVWCRNKSEA
jgi:hypothetical protein